MSMKMSQEDSIESPMKLSTDGAVDSAINPATLDASLDEQKQADDQQQQQQVAMEANDNEFDPSDLQYKQTKDRYVGGIDPVTKLRQGHGCYTFTNPFFQYQGEFDKGKKSGK